MAGYKRNHDLSASNDNEENLLVDNNSGRSKRQHSETNDKESICWKYFEPFQVPRENGIETKCMVSGCTTKYMWCGSTSNLIRHLRINHGIIKSSSSTLTSTTSNTNLVNSELKINVPLINLFISSGVPLSFIDNLKSAGFINPQYEFPTSNILEKQIINAYNQLFLQLKLKAQQEKFVMLSIHGKKIALERYVIITCHWLTEDLELHEIL
ncbi:17816_t:CDS:1, partial [Racocetra persica]